MQSLKQIRHDLVYNFIYEIQHMKLSGNNFPFFSELILDHAVLQAVKDVTYDINTVQELDDVKFDDADLNEKIKALPNSLQSPIVMRAAISLIDHFVKVTRIESDIVDIMHDDAQILAVRDGMKIPLEQYKKLYKEIIAELIEYAEQNDIELSDGERLGTISTGSLS